MKAFSCCKDPKDNTINIRVDCKCFSRPKVYKIEIDDDREAEIFGKRLHTLLNQMTEELVKIEIEKLKKKKDKE